MKGERAIMEKLISEINPDGQRGVIEGPTDFRTRDNHYELNCGMCGKRLFVDGETVDRVRLATEEGLDNPLCCTDCEEEYDDLFYEG